jgi:hypothetical protein
MARPVFVVTRAPRRHPLIWVLITAAFLTAGCVNGFLAIARPEWWSMVLSPLLIAVAGWSGWVAWHERHAGSAEIPDTTIP